MSGAVRSDVELLQLLLDNIDGLCTGLCSLAGRLYDSGEITLEEHSDLVQVIGANRPDSYQYNFPYFFPTALKQPRIDFLNSLIQKYGATNNS